MASIRAKERAMAEWTIETRGPVEVWTIAGEARRNTLTRGLCEELRTLARALPGRREVRAVVLTGQGDKAFCAGADLKDREKMSHDDVRAWLVLLHEAFRALELAPQPTIAALNGVAFGGGLELALACDLRVADPGAAMGLTEVKLGIIPGAGGTQRLPRAIGVSRAKELIFTGRRVLAAEAMSMGLVNKLSAPGLAVNEAVDLAREIAENAPLALAQAKSAITDGYDLPWDEAAALERAKYDPLLATKDRLEGLAAFRDKRKPNYRGE
jgi:enoyl-CoA hydratase/carnithine racemase